MTQLNPTNSKVKARYVGPKNIAWWLKKSAAAKKLINQIISKPAN